MKKKKGPIIAAGGVLIRPRNVGEQVLLCYRPKYQDWCLPKGKQEKHETIEDCALREIKEETGCNVLEFGTFLGHTEYRSGARQKFVYWWLVWEFIPTHDPLAHDVERTKWVYVEGSGNRAQEGPASAGLDFRKSRLKKNRLEGIRKFLIHSREEVTGEADAE